MLTPIPEHLSDEADEALQMLQNNIKSSAISVADHLKTVASNSEEQASDEHLIAEAKNLQEAAQFFIDRVSDGTNEKRETFTAVGSIDIYPYKDAVLERMAIASLEDLDLEDSEDVTALWEAVGAAVTAGEFAGIEEFDANVIDTEETGHVNLKPPAKNEN